MRHSALVSAGASCATWSRLLGCLILGAVLLAGESAVRWQDASPSVTEGSGPLTTHLMVTPPASSAVTVVWKTNAESASAGTDYVDATTTTVIPAGQSRTAVSVGIVNDAYNRGSRTFGLQILSISGANWGSPNYVSATIADDDTSGPPATAPAVSWTPASTNVPSGAGATGFTVSLAYAWTSTVAVQWHANAESAQAGVDFAAAGGTLTFAPGETAKDAVVTILAGAKAGSKFGLQIDAITGGAWGTPNYQSITITGAQLPAATPVVSPPAGTYSDVVTATAATATAGATLRYRLDGTTPNAADAVMPAAGLAIDGPATLAVRAFASGMQPSATATAAYAFAVADLTADVASGTYNTPQSVTLASASPGVGIRYTLDGSAPTASSPLADGPVAVTRSATLRAIGMRDGWSSSAELSRTYVLAVAAPAADLASGTYTGSRSVTLSTTSPDADIRYTLDGSAPTAASPLATAPIVLPGSCTLKAVAMRDGWTASAVVSFTYRLRVPTPTVTPTGGTYYVPQTVAAAVDLAEAVIRYTTDGSAPTATSAEWPAAGLAVDRTTPLRLRAFKAGWLDSGVRSATYTLKVSAITATPRGGTYVGGRSVVLATTTPLAVIRYTTDGSVPTSASAVADGPISIDVTTVLRAVASRDGWADSSAFRTTYTIQVAPVVADLASGTYVGQRSVGLSCVTDGAEIRYTLDGSTPTAASSLYAGPIALPGSCTLKAVAQQAGLKDSAVLSRSYALRVEPVSASLPAGTYIGEQQVVLSTPTADAFVRYTLDGTAPSATNGETATGPVTIQGNKTLRAVAMRAGWRNSAAFSALYRLRVPAPTATPPAGTYAAWPLVTAQDADASATIRYTTGTSIPGSSSTVFPSGGLQLSKATTLNLIATRTGWTNSLVTTGAYALNLAPVAPPVAVSTDEDVAVAVAPTAVDVDSPSLAWSVAATPAHGTLDGFDAATGAVSYIPAADWNGADAFQLAVSDGTSTVAVPVAVTVRAVNDAPVAAALRLTGDEDTALTGQATATDADGDALTWSLAADAVHGVATVTPAGVVSYVPMADWNGADAFQLAVSDGTSTVAVPVTVTVRAVNDAPVAAALQLTGDEDTTLTGQATASDADGDALSWSLSTFPVHGVAGVSASGAVTFIPDPNWNGSDAFTLMVGDGTTTVSVPVSVQVFAVDDPAAVVVPTGLSAVAMGDVLITGLSVSDLDTPLLSVQVTADAGAVFLPGGGDTISGDATAVAAALAQAIYRAPDSAGSASITVTANGVSSRFAVTVDAAPMPMAIAPGTASSWPGETNYAPRLFPQRGRLYQIEVQQAGEYYLWRYGYASRSRMLDVLVDGIVPGRLGITARTAPTWGVMGASGAQVLVLGAGVHAVVVTGTDTDVVLDRLLLVARTPASSTVAEHPVMVGPGAVAILDAAAYDEVSEGSGFSWLPDSGGSLHVLPNLEVSEAGTQMARGLSYHIYVTQAGTYRIWGLGCGGPSDDSVWVGVDGAAPQTHITWAGNPTMRWSRWRDDGGSSDVVLPAGYHRFDIRWREDGVTLRQIAISGNAGWSARGLVHPISSRLGVAAPAADGSLVVEAEAASQLVQGQDYTNWTLQTDVIGSVGSVQRLLPDTGRGVIDQAKLPDVPAVIWYVNFDRAGVYDVWLRGAGPNYGGDSVIFGMATDPGPLTGVRLNGVGPSLPLAWSQVRDDGSRATINVPAPGIFPIIMWMREDGAAVDRILIQPSGGPAPLDAGPAASPLVSPLAGNS